MSRTTTRWGLIAAAIALVLTLALAAFGSASASQFPAEDRYAESQDLQNLVSPVVNLRGYDLDQPNSAESQQEAIQTRSAAGTLAGVLSLSVLLAVITTIRWRRNAERFGWNSGPSKGRWHQHPF